MSQNDSEDDIWEYKPLEKKKKRPESSPATGTKRRCTARRASRQKTEVPHSANPQDSHVQITANTDRVANGHRDNVCSSEAHGSSSDSFGGKKSSHEAQGSSSEDFCPICQMPFSILVVQSQRWHVSECLDVPRDQCKECPDGLRCSSTIPNHYKTFNHTLLAVSRADGDATVPSLSQQGGGASKESSLHGIPGPKSGEVNGCSSGASQDGALSLSAPSSQSVSPDDCQAGTPHSKRPNSLLLLRSPGPEDLKKKKGWLSSSQSQKSVASSQESQKELSSTPVKEDRGEKTCERSPKTEYFPEFEDAISFSPLSELPADTEVDITECRKALFHKGASENEGENSMTLFTDSFSSEDELYAEFIEKNLEGTQAPGRDPASSDPQLGSVPSLAPGNQAAASTVTAGGADSSGVKEAPGKSREISSTSLQSPQSIVLERLRETLLTSDLPFKNSSIHSEQPCTTSQFASSQNSFVPKSQSMPPQKGQSKAGQAAGLRQTDIGVFFGLKPLKVKEAEKELSEPNTTAAAAPPAVENSGRKRPRRERQRKPRGEPAAAASQATDAVGSGNAGDVQGAAWRGGSRGWRRGRRNRINADGEVELPRCPFYKKIPGTKFTVDAFRYGAIEGVSAYFLTHFHSDHYGGLTKNSTLPIYCNKITGNLVKSKLRVAEQHVHILPMNTEVTVEGVRVILLDANHCPGAAMLLFFLPDGQTVLHTGDFRADPSMETYPELLSCRVQTLYLDTTYCSPEYTFPKQQDVINFATSVAFESVTLNPRTLVVCGSYSVGKEKVFLALAEVLGSKVCLSRDKYNTMCCLESAQVRERVITDWKAAQVHVLPMMQLTFNKLRDHLARFSRQYDRLVAFKPTGWTFSQQVDSVQDIQPQTSGNISIYGIPYSEHSGFLELKRFVQWLQPLKIIPTVNVGSWESRKAMERCFGEWLAESKAKR